MEFKSSAVKILQMGEKYHDVFLSEFTDGLSEDFLNMYANLLFTNEVSYEFLKFAPQPSQSTLE